jgi:hypothetical protein
VTMMITRYGYLDTKDTQILVTDEGYIEFWGEIGECPRCHNQMKDLVFLKHFDDDWTSEGGEDLSWDMYRCPQCNSTVTFGVASPLGMCFWEES